MVIFTFNVFSVSLYDLSSFFKESISRFFSSIKREFCFRSFNNCSEDISNFFSNSKILEIFLLFFNDLFFSFSFSWFNLSSSFSFKSSNDDTNKFILFSICFLYVSCFSNKSLYFLYISSLTDFFSINFIFLFKDSFSSLRRSNSL